MKTTEWVIAAGLVLLAWKMWQSSAASAASQNLSAAATGGPDGWQYFQNGAPVGLRVPAI